jgi:exopolysaccharide biosynthesis protein
MGFVIVRGVAAVGADIPVGIMTGRRGRLLWIIAACALVALAAGFLARGPIERAAFARAASRALGSDVDVSSATYANGVWDVRDLAIGTAASPVLEAPHATIALAPTTRITLDRPNLTIADIHGGIPAVDAFARAYPGATVRVAGGRIAAGGLAFGDVDGTLAFEASPDAPPLFEGTLALVDGNRSYPIALHASTPRGLAGQAIVADAIPAAAFAALQDASEMKPTAGVVRDVNVAVVRGSLAGTARLDDVTFLMFSHSLHGLHGDLVFGSGGVGTKAIAGSLDAVPFDAVGEVHDLPQPFAWLAGGSRDLQAFAKLIREIADEPDLRSVHFDTTAPGLGFAMYAMQTDHGPLVVNVLTIDPAEPTLRFDTAIAEDHVISSGERTSAMGVRTGAVAGVNGDYFDIGRTYEPQGMLERSGEIVRGPVQRAALVIDKSKHVRFDLFHIEGTVRVGGAAYPITQVNDWPVGEATVITPAFGKTLPADPGTTFATIEPTGSANRYRVTSVSDASASLPVSLGVAFGAATHAKVRVGEIIGLSYRIVPSIDGAIAAIGGGPILVRDGAWYEDPDAPAPDERDYRWPVVALARQADDHLLLVAVDGRHPERSVGMTRPEFADLLIRFGVTDAMALDSGGSVTMVSRAPGDANVTVRNVPSDHSAERWVSDALFLYSSAPQPSLVPIASPATPAPESRPTP